MKRILGFLTSVLLVLVLTVAQQDIMTSSINRNTKINTEQAIAKSDIIDWRYKTENNKLYRRLYNYSKDQWIGEWELC